MPNLVGVDAASNASSTPSPSPSPEREGFLWSSVLQEWASPIRWFASFNTTDSKYDVIECLPEGGFAINDDCGSLQEALQFGSTIDTYEQDPVWLQLPTAQLPWRFVSGEPLRPVARAGEWVIVPTDQSPPSFCVYRGESESEPRTITSSLSAAQSYCETSGPALSPEEALLIARDFLATNTLPPGFADKEDIVRCLNDTLADM